MWKTNVHGTKNLLEAALKANVKRFVHCSTIGVHGCIKNPPANEETAYGPGDDYQRSKTEAERIVRTAMSEGRLPIVIFRPAGIYGPRDLRFLKLFKAIKNRRFMVLGSGKITYHFVYIDDLIDGVLLCGTEAKSVGRIYILAGEAPVTLNRLVEVIAETLGVSAPTLRFPVTPVYLAGYVCELLCKPFGINPPLYRRRVDFFRKNRAFDISKARKDLGFNPRTNLPTGIRLTAQWYQKNGLL
jgi:nucleoside-diphosphate-sugar epimerase